MLEKEFEYYLKNQHSLLEKYNGFFIVIMGEEVIGHYNTREKAYFETIKEHAIGKFLIQFCEPGKGAYTQSFHSRVIFS